MHIYGLQMKLSGRVEIKNVVDKVKLDYPNLSGNRLNEKIEEELQLQGNFQKCMDKEHREAKSNAINTSSNAELILTNKIGQMLSHVNEKKNIIKDKLNNQKQSNVEMSSRLRRQISELENNRKLLEKRNIQNAYFNRETPQPTQ